MTQLKKAIWIGLVLLLAAFAAGYYFYRSAQADLPVVKVTKPQRGPVEAKVYATGTIDTAEKQEVRLFSPAVVKNVPVSVGGKIKSGDLLLELETKDLDLQIKQAQAALEVAKANADAARARLSALEQAAAAPAVPQVQLPNQAGLSVDEAKIALRQAQAGVSQAQATLDLFRNQKNNAKIKAAVSGTVLAVNVSANQTANPQLPLIIVGNLDRPIIVSHVNEVDAARLAVGQNVKITGATLNNREFSGKVTELAPMAESQASVQGSQTTVQMKVEITERDPGLKPGYSVSLTVVTAAKPDALQLPVEAIFSQGKDKYLYKLSGETLQKVKVETGISGDVNVEVTGGISEGDRIVLNPSKNLQEGMKVKVE